MSFLKDAFCSQNWDLITVFRIWNSARLIFNQCLSKVRRWMKAEKETQTGHIQHLGLLTSKDRLLLWSLCVHCFCDLSMIFILLVMKSKYLFKYIKTHFCQEAPYTYLFFFFPLIYALQRLISYFGLKDFYLMFFSRWLTEQLEGEEFSCVFSSFKLLSQGTDFWVDEWIRNPWPFHVNLKIPTLNFKLFRNSVLSK